MTAPTNADSRLARRLRKVRGRLGATSRRWAARRAVGAVEMTAGEGAVTVLVASPTTPVDLWLARFPDAEVHVLWFRSAPRGRALGPHDAVFDGTAELREALRSMPPVDLFVDARKVKPRSQANLWAWAYFYVRAGGRYVVVQHDAPTSTAPAGRPLWLAGWPSDEELPLDLSTGDPAELASATAELTTTDRAVTFLKRSDHAVTVTEREVETVLPARLRHTQVTTLATLPGEQFTSRTVVDHHDPVLQPGRVDTELDVPPMTLRSYEGEIFFHGHMTFSAESTVLPHSYRYPWGRNANLHLPHQPYAAKGNHAYRLKDASGAPWLPDGDYVDLTHPFHGHFGHLMAQTIPRLWALDIVNEQLPDARFLLPTPTASAGRDTRPYEMVFAAGVPRDRVTWVSKPVRMRHLVAPSLGLQYSPTLFVHPAVVETWAELRDRLVEVDPNSPAKIFVSRRYGEKKRGCRNAAEVDRTFEEHGFTVVYPEDHTMLEQARIFGNARVIAGFGGSGMYNSIFADRLDAMVIINSDSYSGRTEHLIALRKAARLDYFWNRPLVRSGADYTSPFDFEFGRHGAALRRTLASL